MLFHVFLPTISGMSLDSFDDVCCPASGDHWNDWPVGSLGQGAARAQRCMLYNIVARLCGVARGNCRSRHWFRWSSSACVRVIFFQPCMCSGMFRGMYQRVWYENEMGISLRSVIRVMSNDVAFVFMVGPRTAEPGHIWKPEIWINLKHVARKGSWVD